MSLYLPKRRLAKLAAIGRILWLEALGPNKPRSLGPNNPTNIQSTNIYISLLEPKLVVVGLPYYVRNSGLNPPRENDVLGRQYGT